MINLMEWNSVSIEWRYMTIVVMYCVYNQKKAIRGVSLGTTYLPPVDTHTQRYHHRISLWRILVEFFASAWGWSNIVCIEPPRFRCKVRISNSDTETRLNIQSSLNVLQAILVLLVNQSDEPYTYKPYKDSGPSQHYHLRTRGNSTQAVRAGFVQFFDIDFGFDIGPL